jgi:hypothetical protein
MPKNLDYSVAWSDAVRLLNAHREAVVAIAGFFLFATAWAFAFLVPEIDMTGVVMPQQMVEVVRNYFLTNWQYLLLGALSGSYGGFVIYVLLSGYRLTRVGDALTIALSRFLPFFVASILTGWLTSLGLIAFIIPGLYLFARFALIPAAMAADPELGILGGIRQSWSVTGDMGWRIFLLLLVVLAVSWLLMTVLNLIIGIACVTIAGPEGIKIVQTFFAALFSTVQGVVIIALITAIYRQLAPQMAKQ